MAYAVIDDRERYRMLKYDVRRARRLSGCISRPGVARFLTASVSVVITLAAASVSGRGDRSDGGELAAVPRRRSLSASSCWPCSGCWLGGIILLLAHQSWSVGEAVAGALYLFSGAVFPLDVLPAWLRPIGYAMPVTYWLELLRRSLTTSRGFQTFAGVSDLQLFGCWS